MRGGGDGLRNGFILLIPLLSPCVQTTARLLYRVALNEGDNSQKELAMHSPQITPPPCRLPHPPMAPLSLRLRPSGHRAVLTHRQGHHAIRVSGGPAASLTRASLGSQQPQAAGHPERTLAETQQRRRHAPVAPLARGVTYGHGLLSLGLGFVNRP